MYVLDAIGKRGAVERMKSSLERKCCKAMSNFLVFSYSQGPPNIQGPPKIIPKIFLEQNKMSYTLDRILYGYASEGLL